MELRETLTVADAEGVRDPVLLTLAPLLAVALALALPVPLTLTDDVPLGETAGTPEILRLSTRNALVDVKPVHGTPMPCEKHS